MEPDELVGGREAVEPRLTCPTLEAIETFDIDLIAPLVLFVFEHSVDT